MSDSLPKTLSPRQGVGSAVASLPACVSLKLLGRLLSWASRGLTWIDVPGPPRALFADEICCRHAGGGAWRRRRAAAISTAPRGCGGDGIARPPTYAGMLATLLNALARPVPLEGQVEHVVCSRPLD